MSNENYRRSKPQTDVTSTSRSMSGPQTTRFAASLRKEKNPNRDVFIKTKSPKLHKSRVSQGEKSVRRRNEHKQRRGTSSSSSRFVDSKVDVGSSLELVRYDPPQANDDWYHTSQQSSPGHQQESASDVNNMSSQRAALLARRRKLRGIDEPSAPTAPPSQPVAPTSEQRHHQSQHHQHQSQHHHQQHHQQQHHHSSSHRNVAVGRATRPALTVDALAEASFRDSTFTSRSRYAGSSAPGSPKRTPSTTNVSFGTSINRVPGRDRRPPSSIAADSTTTNGAAREQTRIFRMSGLTPRELVIENLRLQDQMTELQDRQHESIVTNMRLNSGEGGIVVNDRRTDRSVNVLATTNADLSRRVQSAVVGEANAMARLQRMEEETKQQEKRFSELVEISRNEEKAREESETFANECQASLRVAEDRVVRLLSRLHAETQNTTRLKKMVAEGNDRSNGEQAGDAALARAYEQTQAECEELRSQVGQLRQQNSDLIERIDMIARQQHEL